MEKPELKIAETVNGVPTYAICSVCGPAIKFHPGSWLRSPEDAWRRIDEEFRKHLKKYHEQA
jgi:hypothetical protein